MKKKLLLLFIWATMAVSCTSTTYEAILPVASLSPTYTKDVAVVISSNCLSCHAAGSQFPTLEAYEQVRDAAENGALICRIDQTQACGSVMPQTGALPRPTIDMLLLWQNEGYKN